MAIAMGSVALFCAMVYLSAPLWGIEVSVGDRWLAVGLTGAISLALVLVDRHGTLWFMGLIAILSIVAVVDRTHRIIPNRLVVMTGLWALIDRIMTGHWLNAIGVAAAIFIFYLSVHVITHGGLGMGDVKFGAVLALALGYPAGLVGMFAGIWTAGIYAAFLLIARRNIKNSRMALGPFLAFGGIIGLLDLLR